MKNGSNNNNTCAKMTERLLSTKLGLQNDIEKTWDMTTTSMPVVISALGWCSHEKNRKYVYLATKIRTSG